MLRVVNLFVLGILAGAMFEEYFFFSVILAELPPDTWAGLHARFGIVHPFTVIPLAALTTITLGVVAVRERRAPPPLARRTWAGVIAAVLILLLTAVVMMPMNFAIESWATAGIPDDAALLRSRWSLFQGVRALLSVAAFAVLLAAVPRVPTAQYGEGAR